MKEIATYTTGSRRGYIRVAARGIETAPARPPPRQPSKRARMPSPTPIFTWPVPTCSTPSRCSPWRQTKSGAHHAPRNYPASYFSRSIFSRTASRMYPCRLFPAAAALALIVSASTR